MIFAWPTACIDLPSGEFADAFRNFSDMSGALTSCTLLLLRRAAVISACLAWLEEEGKP
jgi:hypothetical protein